MPTQYYTATSLDGYIATEDNSLDWLFPLGDVNDTRYLTFITEVGALVMGSSTYERMLRDGKPLFPRRLASPPLRLDSVRQSCTGFADLRYTVPRLTD